MATEPTGRIFFEIGRPQDKQVAYVDVQTVIQGSESMAHGMAGSSIRSSAPLSTAKIQLEADGPAQETQKSPSPSPPGRITSDGDRGLLISQGDRIARISSDGGGSFVAGHLAGKAERFLADPSGDGGPAESARFVAIEAITSDEDGTLFIAERVFPDKPAFRLRFMNRSNRPRVFFAGTEREVSVSPGVIRTIVGTSAAAVNGAPISDSDRVRNKELWGEPPTLAVIGERLYVSSLRTLNGAKRASWSGVQLLNLSGTTDQAHGVSIEPGDIKLIAGGRRGYAGDGGKGLSASFSNITGMTANEKGNLFIADQGNNRIRRLDTTGTVSTFAGSGDPKQRRFGGNEGPATEAFLNRPFDVKVGQQLSSSGEITTGNVYISDRGNHQLRFVDEAGFIHAAPGNAIGISWRCGATGKGARMTRAVPQKPIAISSSPNGAVFFLNDSGDIRRLVSGESRRLAGIAGAGLIEATEKGIYVFELEKPRIRFINLGRTTARVQGVSIGPGKIDTIAGTGKKGDQGDGGPARKANLEPGNLAADPEGTLFVSDPKNHSVRVIDGTGRVTRILSSSSKDSNECCFTPGDVATDSKGNLYLTDGPRIWFLNRSKTDLIVHGTRVQAGSAVAIAGNGALDFGDEGGAATQSPTLGPTIVTADSFGNLYFAEGVAATGKGSVRKIDRSGTLTTIATLGTSFVGDGLNSTITPLGPNDLTTDNCGNLLVAEARQSRVRKVNLVQRPCD